MAEGHKKYKATDAARGNCSPHFRVMGAAN